MSQDDVDRDPGSVTDQRLQQGQAMREAMEAVDTGVTGDIDFVAPSVRDNPARIGLGLVVVLAGLAAVVGVDAVPDLPFGNGVVAGISISAILTGALVLVRRTFTDYETATTADVEYRESVTVPGADFDDALAGAIHGTSRRRVDARRDATDRLRRAALAIYAQAERIPEAEAREAVAAGTWTDDPVAAEFLSAESSVATTGDQVRSLVGRRPKLATGADRVLVELAALAPGVDAADWGSEASTDADRPATVRTTDRRRRQVDRRTNRWTGLTGLGLLAVGVGIWAGHSAVPPSLMVAAATVVGAAGYVYLSSPPPVELAVERELSTTDPAPGEEVTVTVRVTNESDDLLPDLRLVDGIPPAVRVVDGSPRFATALRAGETVAFSYTVEAVRGDHPFDPVQVILRDFSGALERERHVQSDDGTTLSTALELSADEEVPVHPQTARRVGRVVTDTGGSGVELHSVREYQRGDPLSRIDWNRVARTGEFATLLFREEHAATVVVLVDARAEAYVAPRVDAPSAVDHGIAAADVVVASLIGAGDSVGLAALSPERCWLEPRGGATQAARARSLLERHPAFDGNRPEGAFYGEFAERRLRRELPSDAQLVLCSPLCDDDAVDIVRQLHARGFPVTVLSPDVTASGSTGQRLATVERAMRISRLRRVGVRVVDWDPANPLETAIDAAQRRWSA
ncbi:DUF58 domain-containing protein [Halosimplex halophilum]|uniref:DUF58 domain-containing protein n=1 Tax=Halosimplex halophilum TaxID=2559572 RepID=UPI00107F205E|nr:DUF58 domain-containing protein [Halosimplex halophilum]